MYRMPAEVYEPVSVYVSHTVFSYFVHLRNKPLNKWMELVIFVRLLVSFCI